MNIMVAGKDRSAEFATRLAPPRPEARPPRFLAPEHSALALREARNTAEYQDRLLELIRIRRGISTADFPIPRKPGLLGAAMSRARAFLWKLLRYQHDRMAFQQNVLNELFSSALEFERDQRRQESDDLRRRLDALKPGGEGSK